MKIARWLALACALVLTAGTGQTSTIFTLSGAAAFTSQTSYYVAASQISGQAGLTFGADALSGTQIQVFFTGNNTQVYNLAFYAVGT